ncbi:unnamed protein product [Spirodela intermedia]|uniref:Uncharacterized protein n=1 Tax=Spirodela intermedia TaxID=51605 RepID=A0A7I8IFX1_SPIIN|nr:unnamed protein product [Spirodela intermedia]CAA6655772.1 unnamed protein product [Spirodela intermedia]
MFLVAPRRVDSAHEKKPSVSDSGVLFSTFEWSLVVRFKSLVPAGCEARPGTSLAYLSRAVGVLSSIHVFAGAFIDDPAVCGFEEAALAAYINGSVKILEVCNAASAEVERLRRTRLHLLLAIRVLSTGKPTPDKIRKARESIREWDERSPRACTSIDLLVREPEDTDAPPWGRMTAVKRTICAVEAASALVGGALVAFVGGKPGGLTVGLKFAREFPWADSFNEACGSLSGETFRSPPREVEAATASARGLAEIIDNLPGNDGEKTEGWRTAMKDLENAAAELTVGLDRLGNAVNALFNVTLNTRNNALLIYRAGGANKRKSRRKYDINY